MPACSGQLVSMELKSSEGISRQLMCVCGEKLVPCHTTASGWVVMSFYGRSQHHCPGHFPLQPLCISSALSLPCCQAICHDFRPLNSISTSPQAVLAENWQKLPGTFKVHSETEPFPYSFGVRVCSLPSSTGDCERKQRD